MFDHLHVNSKRVISSLCCGSNAIIGRNTVNAIDEKSRSLLALLSININDLKDSTGGDLLAKVISLSATFKFDEIVVQIKETDGESKEDSPKGLRLGKIKALSFRGLAPAGIEWVYDFEKDSHLIYGPNGSGKSSLLGAICWCLTGKLFLDYCPPCEPGEITAYPIGGSSTGKLKRDVGQALMDENGNSTLINTEYIVEVQLVGKDSDDNDESIYLQRSSTNGLSWSKDETNWDAIESISEIGIDELDAELRLIIPAQVLHMQFGKNPDLVHLLGEVVGLSDLESIAEAAERLGSGARRAATSANTKELEPVKKSMAEDIKQIKELASKAVEELPEYKQMCANSSKENIKGFGKVMNVKIDATKTQLAIDLGIEIPEEDTEEYKQWEDTSNRLPGQVHDLLTELGKPLGSVFKNSVGFDIPLTDETTNTEEKLKAFESLAINEIQERLSWAKREQIDEKAGLILKAAGHFPEGSNDCPVCNQSLEGVPEIKCELDKLRVECTKEYLQKRIDDFVRSLIARLDSIIPRGNQILGEKSFQERIQEDWTEFKKTYCKDLFLGIAGRFDKEIAIVVSSIPETSIEAFQIPEKYKKEFEEAFSDYANALQKAKGYIELCKTVEKERERISEEIAFLLLESKENSNGEAFKDVLERAKVHSKELGDLLEIRDIARKLFKSVGNAKVIEERICELRELGDKADKIKVLKQNVRSEVVDLVTGEIGVKTKTYYEQLYDNEILKFENLTPGHAENPDIKGQVNLYLRAGNHQVPMEPYSNAGRMRALILSFAFALLDKSSGSLAFIVLDDPALSLDDKHKRRFVNRLVEPQVKKGQVVLGTHYESFFKDSEHVFAQSKNLQMIPREVVSQRVRFEPGDLLVRVEGALAEQSGSWREVGGNLRRWIERSLATISAYCPQRFFVEGNYRDTIKNYFAITDPVVVKEKYFIIRTALDSSSVKGLVHKLHHDKPVEKPDVKDAYEILVGCKNAVRYEIERFKNMYDHEFSRLQNIAGTNVVLDIGSIRNNRIKKDVSVVREAAAAHNKTGIEWDEAVEYTIKGCPVVQVCSDVIAPIALSGQYLLLDWEDRVPSDGDLVVAETHDTQKYIRRIWRDEGAVILESINSTKPVEPVRIVSANCKIRRIVGVLYDESSLPDSNGEWSFRGVNESWFDDIVGVRVKGTSLEPVARHGQIVLIKRIDVKRNIKNDMLACVSIKDIGDVIKRCHISKSHCVLTAINMTDREEPIVVDLESIQQAYELKGVLFEVGSGVSIE